MGRVARELHANTLHSSNNFLESVTKVFLFEAVILLENEGKLREGENKKKRPNIVHTIVKLISSDFYFFSPKT